MPLSITKNIIFSIDSLISAPLVRKVISETNYKGIFQVIGDVYLWVGKKLDTPGSHRMGRAFTVIEKLEDLRTTRKISTDEYTKILKYSQKIINNPDLLQNGWIFKMGKDGANYQDAAIDTLLDSMIAKNGG